MITVPCRKCAACKANKRSEWYIRLKMESKDHDSIYFVTLTYSDNNLTFKPYHIGDGEYKMLASLHKRDVQLFLKRLRKNTGQKLRYFVCGEYGEKTLRPHYHMILFGLDSKQKDVEILKAWQKGHVRVDPISEARMKYVTGYVLKQNAYEFMDQCEFERPFMNCSKKPMLGNSYIKKMKEWHKQDVTRNYVPIEDGKKVRMPEIYRKKIFTEGEREAQRQYIEKLDEIEYQCEEKVLKKEKERSERFKMAHDNNQKILNRREL